MIHDILADAGITVLDARVAPRPGLFNPIGVMLHHTANPQHGDLPSLPLLKKGRADLPGPLVQLGGGREGTIASVTDGRANHAGKGSDVVAARCRADLEPAGPGSDNTDGNTLFVGIEIENSGTGETYPERQLQAVARASAALCLHFGWSAHRVIGHKEWTRRKPDPSFDMPAMRLRVNAFLQAHPGDDEMRPVPYRTRNDDGSNVSGAIFLTSDFTTTRTLSEPAWIHGGNLGWWPKTEPIHIPVSLHDWMVQNSKGLNIP